MPSSIDWWRIFDRLSPEKRKALANQKSGMISVMEADLMSLQEMEEQDNRNIIYMALEDFGPDHPQAKEIQ